ncbi:hypothetical protein ABID19_004504 [Mesorhizobium robiniae]|uniref:Uncharacterized protein n=1 Tax=Mesorhizobium robiniae TaxID=559315 RepID=A0ABV2GT32_9HYPH
MFSGAQIFLFPMSGDFVGPLEGHVTIAVSANSPTPR